MSPNSVTCGEIVTETGEEIIFEQAHNLDLYITSLCCGVTIVHVFKILPRFSGPDNSFFSCGVNNGPLSVGVH